MAFFTRPDFDGRQFKQETGSTITLSGTTNFAGILKSKNVEIDADLYSGLTLMTGHVLTLISDGGTPKIRLEPSTGGGGGSIYYTGNTPAVLSAPVGGINDGYVLTGKTFTEILEDMLIETFNPTLTNPSNTFAENQVNIQEVGIVIPTINFTATFNRGSINPQYPPTSSPYRSGLPNNYNYTGTGIAGTYPSTALVNNRDANNYKMLLGSNQWTSTVSYDAGVQPYDSAGDPYSTPLVAGTTGSKSVTLTGQYIRFYGASATTPATSAQVRALPQSAFQAANVQTFDLNTGAVLIKFVVALPPSRTITSVFDIDALGADITSQYVFQGTITVNDGGGTGDPHSYNLYEMNIGAPYSANHRHRITTA